MTPAEAFKLGFMARCVHDELTGEEMEQRVKLAFSAAVAPAWDFTKSLVSTAAGLGASTAPYAIGTALAAPLGIGGLAAYLKNKALDADSGTDILESRSAEAAEAYREDARRLRQLYERRKRKADSPRRTVLL
jgi:hypothetical protein